MSAANDLNGARGGVDGDDLPGPQAAGCVASADHRWMPYSRATSDAWAASSDVAEMKRVLRPGSRLLILDQVPDFDAFQQGEVLVARATAPAWTALVERARGGRHRRGRRECRRATACTRPYRMRYPADPALARHPAADRPVAQVFERADERDPT